MGIFSRSLYFGWYIVGASTFITLLTVGMRLGIGPFVIPMLEDLQISRTSLSIIIAVSMLVYGIGMPLAGYLINWFSTRFVILIGVFLTIGSIMLTFFSTNLFIFILGYGILLSLGLSFISPVALTPIISNWFTTSRGRALFYLSTGSMAGMAIFNPLSTLLIDNFGWRMTLIIFGGLFLFFVIPIAIFVMREHPPVQSQQQSSEASLSRSIGSSNVSVYDAIKTKPFWQIVIGLFVCGFSMNLLGSHGVPMLMDHSFDSHIASFSIGLIGVTAIFSSIALGSIADRFPRKNILFIIYLVRGLGFLGLVFSAHTWQLYLVAITGGLVWSGSIALSSAILGDLYGIRIVGIVYGWAYLGHQIGAALGSFVGGWGFEQFDTHLFAFGFSFLLLFIASLVSLFLPKSKDVPDLLSNKLMKQG